jgi:hypothetical protein
MSKEKNFPWQLKLLQLNSFNLEADTPEIPMLWQLKKLDSSSEGIQ